jgi:hypothetical protein
LLEDQEWKIRQERKAKKERNEKDQVRAGMAQAEVEHRELYRNGLQDPELD